MKIPAPPIFVVEGLDVTVHKCLEDAQNWLEPWWVRQKEGFVYDAEGRLLKLEARNKRVTISLGEEEPTHASELETILHNYLRAIGEPIGSDPSCNLKCLVEFCRKFIFPPPRSLKDIIIGNGK